MPASLRWRAVGAVALATCRLVVPHSGSIPSRRLDEDDERARFLAADPGAHRILSRCPVERLMRQLPCAAHHPAPRDHLGRDGRHHGPPQPETEHD